VYVKGRLTHIKTNSVLGDTLPGLLVLVFPNVAFLADRRNVILAFGLLCVSVTKVIHHHQSIY